MCSIGSLSVLHRIIPPGRVNAAQVLGMGIATVFFAAVGFLNPANRGSLMVGIVLLFLFMGAIGGYQAARTHKVRRTSTALCRSWRP
jgi:transmembrane 9 superfamily protein 2/4